LHPHEIITVNNQIKEFINQYGITLQTDEFLTQKQGMYINGEFCAAKNEQYFDLIEPCTNSVLTQVPSADSSDVDSAINAAKQAFKDSEWSRMKPNERARVLLKLADLVEENLQTLAEIESLNAGKAISGCKAVDIASSADLLRYMAGWATKIEGSTRSVSAGGEHFAYTLKEAVGVVAAIVPWNWPFSMSLWKLAAPLAVGCTVVLKPSPLTPLSMLYFAKLCEQAGMPNGVLNIITGSSPDVGSYLVSHPEVNKVSFTGSTAVGVKVGTAALNNVTPVTLELGGKSPMVVFADAKIEKVVNATQQSVFFNTGQVCSAGSRLYVHRDIYQQTVSAIVEQANKMKIGATLDPESDMGPAISAGHLQSVCNYIDSGIAEGAVMECGGPIKDKQGFFIKPTVFSGCTNEMKIVQEEIFGPVLVVIPFDTEDQVVALANDNIYGLAASVFTQDISRAQRMVSKLDAGIVWVNTHDLVDSCIPFGGFKKSGFGKDMGPEQLDCFLKTKAVWIEIDSEY
jgi:phenylacetaldehyde dehydrogenase